MPLISSLLSASKVERIRCCCNQRLLIKLLNFIADAGTADAVVD